MFKKTSKTPAHAGPSLLPIPFNSIQSGLSEDKAVFRLIHFWEARNPTKGGVLIGLELFLIDEQVLVWQNTNIVLDLKTKEEQMTTATKVQEMIGTVDTTGDLSAFEKMEEKVMAMESDADALSQIGTDELDGKFQMLETSSVDDDLADLKKELSGSSKIGELPPGRSTVAANTRYPFKDSEIENELNELRRKANEF